MRFCDPLPAVTRRALLIAAALALGGVTLAAYHGVLENGFVNYDDDLCITNVPAVQAGLTLQGVVWAFTSFHCANWFPLTWLSWMLDAEWFGLSPRAFHATSLALHVVNVWLALLAFTRLTGSFGVGAFAAGVFALHPLHVESVAWAAARKDVLSGTFWLLALLAYEHWARRGPTVWRGMAVVLSFCLGLLAKPILVTLPCVLLLLDVWPLRRVTAQHGGGWDAKRIRLALLEKAGLLAIAALFGTLVLVAQSAGGAMTPLERYPLGVRVGNALVAYATYLRRLFLPTDLAVFYPHPGGLLSTAAVTGAAVLLLGVSALACWQHRRRPQLAVGWLWWAVTLAPVIGIVQVGQAAMADRYTYLAQSGLVLALAATLAPLADRSRATRIGAGVLAGAVLLALAVATSAQVETWRSSTSLFEQALRVTQRNHVAHVNLALVHLERRELDRAESHLADALRLAPASATAHGLLGNLRLEQARAPEALREFELALRIEPLRARWLAGLASAQLVAGREPEAIASLERAVANEPTSALFRAHLGRALANQGRLDEALDALAAATRLEPTSAEFAALHARILDRAGRVPQAIAGYREAIALGAPAPDLRNNLAWLLATSDLGGPGAAAEAVALAEQAVAALGGRDAGALDTLAVAYAAAGRHAEARSATARALVLAEAGGDHELAAQLRERLARDPAADR